MILPQIISEVIIGAPVIPEVIENKLPPASPEEFFRLNFLFIIPNSNKISPDRPS